MLDHVGIPVSNYAKSKAFFITSLKPLGYGLIVEVSSPETGGANQAGFGAGKKAEFWIGEGVPLKGRVHFAFKA